MTRPSAFRMALLSGCLLAGLAAAQNRQVLDLADGGAHLDAKLLDTAGKQVILLGESHGIALNEDLDLALLRYLHKSAGVRVYLAEMSYSEGCLFNRYLDTGDEKLLDFLMHQFAGSIAWTREHRTFFINLRRWNLALPEEERIRFAGVDVEHQRGVALRYLAEIARPAPPPPIAGPIAELQKIEKSSGKVTDEFIRALTSSLAAHHEEYAAWLGEGLFDFELVAMNLLKAAEYYAVHGTEQSAALRERAIYDTFLKVYPRLGGAKCYGRWGSAHVAQESADRGEPFAAMLNRPDSPVAGEVLSLFPLYRDAEALTTPAYRKQSASSNPAFLKPFASEATAPVTLFKLTGSDSPFPSGSFQYVVVMRNATASHPLEDAVSLAASGLPAVVVRTIPESGSKDVPVDLAEIRVTFSRQMKDGSWSWVLATPYPAPQMSGLHYESDHRTIVGKVRLAPGTTYAVWLNKDGFLNFKDAQGQPALPYLLTFQTAKAK